MKVHGGRLIKWTVAVAAAGLAASAAQAQMPEFDSDDIGGVVTSAARALTNEGVLVISGQTARRQQMNSLLQRFAQAAANADGVVVVLSGRFINSSTETYFLPTDSTEEAVPYPTDLRGNARVVDDPDAADTGVALVGQAVDMGAFEFQPPFAGCNHKTFRRRVP